MRRSLREVASLVLAIALTGAGYAACSSDDSTPAGAGGGGGSGGTLDGGHEADAAGGAEAGESDAPETSVTDDAETPDGGEEATVDALTVDVVLDHIPETSVVLPLDAPSELHLDVTTDALGEVSIDFDGGAE